MRPAEARLESLDVLRGLAVLGIYVVNVQAFALTNFEYANPSLFGDFGPQDQAIWLFVTAAFQHKFITIFTALFGAGIVLMLGEEEDERRLALHRRRMFWLLLIGLIHAYGFWYGDILVPYAAAGFVVAGARTWPVRQLVSVGIALVLLTSLLFLAATGTAAGLEAEDYAALVAEQWAPPPEALEERRALFRASWVERFGPLAALTFEYQTSQLVFYGPRLAGLMMLGMALQKSGFFAGAWPVGRCWAAAALAPAFGVASWAGARWQLAVDFALVDQMWGQAVLFLAAPLQALGYAALVMLACRSDTLRLVRLPFAAAGRMALSAYLACTVASWLLFYGPPGLGLLGRLTRLEQLWVVLAVWLAILAVAPIWFRVFRFGPAEWAWRSLTYRRAQPFRRSDPPA